MPIYVYITISFANWTMECINGKSYIFQSQFSSLKINSNYFYSKSVLDNLHIQRPRQIPLVDPSDKVTATINQHHLMP